MTIGSLIKELEKLPADMHVFLYYDGAPRLVCDGAFIALVKDYELDERIGLILCETRDVYNATEKTQWVFKHEEVKDG